MFPPPGISDAEQEAPHPEVKVTVTENENVAVQVWTSLSNTIVKPRGWQKRNNCFVVHSIKEVKRKDPGTGLWGALPARKSYASMSLFGLEERERKTETL